MANKVGVEEERKRLMPEVAPVSFPMQGTYNPAQPPRPNSSSSANKGSKGSKPSGYNAPVYNDKYYRSGIDTSYYDNAIKSYTQQANQQRATQLGEARKAQQNALQQAYIQRVQNQRQLNNNLATAGIRGGATESSNINLMNQYGQARASANADYTNSVNSINQSIDQNIRDYTMDMQSRAEEYRQNTAQARWQAAREDYWNKVNAQREDKQNKITNDQNKINAKIERYNAYYTDVYSNVSKDKAEKDLKSVTKQLSKKGLSELKRAQLEQKKRAISVRLKAIADNK